MTSCRKLSWDMPRASSASSDSRAHGTRANTTSNLVVDGVAVVAVVIIVVLVACYYCWWLCVSAVVVVCCCVVGLGGRVGGAVGVGVRLSDREG